MLDFLSEEEKYKKKKNKFNRALSRSLDEIELKIKTFYMLKNDERLMNYNVVYIVFVTINVSKQEMGPKST